MEVNLDEHTGKDWDKALGLRLRHWREEHGLTQTAIGNLLDVSFQMVQKYEKGHCRLPAQSLPRLAELFKVSIEDILGITSAPHNPKPRNLAAPPRE